MKSRLGMIAKITTIITMGALHSCQKEESKLARPVIEIHELGIDNSHSASIGGDLHIDADIVAEGIIKQVIVEIHAEGDHGQDIEATYDHLAGNRNASFHQHIEIPATATAGAYHFHLIVTDQEGNETTAEAEITLQ